MVSNNWNFPPWGMRWWRVPGENLWSGIVKQHRYTAQLSWVAPDLWGLTLMEDDHARNELAWDFDAHTLLGADELDADVAHSLRNNLEERGRGIVTLSSDDLEVLGTLACRLWTQEWMSGKRLRRGLGVRDLAEFTRRTARLAPRYLRVDRTTSDDFYSLTLPGLLIAREPRSLAALDAILAAITSKFTRDPDAREYTWSDLEEAGARPEDSELVWSVASIANLMGGGSKANGLALSLRFGMPGDVERLSLALQSHGFAEYVLPPPVTDDSVQPPRVDRPWASAPLWNDRDGTPLLQTNGYFDPRDYLTTDDADDAITALAREVEPIRYPRVDTKKQGPIRRAIVLTALALEFEAVQSLLTNITEAQNQQGTIYSVGELVEGNATWRVAVGEIGPGNSAAASEIERALHYFNPEVALFVGIAGGIKDVRIGDIVFATSVYGYEGGREQATRLKPRGRALSATYRLEQRARAEARRSIWKTWAASRTGDDDLASASVLLGPIAAGEKVIASTRGATARLIRESYSDVLAVEMEGRGFLEGVRAHDIEAGVVRGISDLLSGKSKADEHGSQAKAARRAALFAMYLLTKL